MGVNRSVSSGSGQVFAITIWDVLASFGVTETFGETEIDNVHIVLLLPDADQEVVWLDVTVKEVA